MPFILVCTINVTIKDASVRKVHLPQATSSNWYFKIHISHHDAIMLLFTYGVKRRCSFKPQVVHLEARQACGSPLDPQQLIKVAQKSALTAALALLDGGASSTDVQAALNSAQPQQLGAGAARGKAQGAAAAVGAAAGPSRSKDIGTGSSAGASGRASLGAAADVKAAGRAPTAPASTGSGWSPVGGQHPGDDGSWRRGSSPPAPASPMLQSTGRRPTVSAAGLSPQPQPPFAAPDAGSSSGGFAFAPQPAGFQGPPPSTAGTAPAGKSAKKPPAPQMRKGGLSMFLSGALDQSTTPLPVIKPPVPAGTQTIAFNWPC